MFVVKCHASVMYKVDWCEHVTRVIFSRLSCKYHHPFSIIRHRPTIEMQHNNTQIMLNTEQSVVDNILTYRTSLNITLTRDRDGPFNFQGGLRFFFLKKYSDSQCC
jgi:hypothetical protein